MLGKLDAETVVGALVQASDEPLDDEARDEVQPAQLAHEVGIEQAAFLSPANHAILRLSPCGSVESSRPPAASLRPLDLPALGRAR
jgi:hypothetical protein